MWNALDVFFLVFHSAIILFNVFGWIFRRTRRWNLMLLLLTGFSWTFLGVFYGFGYCPLTEWHWQVLDHIGTPSPYSSYIQYFINRMTGIKLGAGLSESLTLIVYLLSLVCSVTINYFTKQHHPEQYKKPGK